MKDLLNIINEYLLIYPNEKEKLNQLLDYVSKNTYDDIIDWNNFNGHIVASGFIYSKNDRKFLVLYHKDQKMFLYPGGHVDKDDESILSATIREVKEETGITNSKLIKVCDNELVPIDIDIHKISYNERLNLPEHYHYDFRYLFVIDSITDVFIDEEESSDYK